MQVIEILPEERGPAALPAEKVAAALAAMEEDGVVLLRNALSVQHVDALGAKMLADLEQFTQDHALDNNFQGLRPPPFAPYLFRDIVFNEPAIAVSRALLGPEVTLTSYGANTAFVGSGEQQVHADTVPAEAGPYRPCPYLVVNVPLVDMTLENGATVFWPGTHKDTRLVGGNRFPTPQMIADWEAHRPAERVLARRGDVALRDLRVWHGGMPNRTRQHRPMLALVHRAERPTSGTFEAEAGSEEFWVHPVLNASPAFLEKPIDYLHQGHSRPGRP